MAKITRYGYARMIEELLDDALNDLEPAQYKKLLEDIIETIKELQEAG